MALNYDNLTAICEKKYMPVLADNTFNSSLFFSKLRAKPDVITGGEKIVEPLLYAKGRGGWYGEWDLLDVSPKETRTAVHYDFGYAYANMTISGQQEDKVTGDSAVLNLLDVERQTAEKTLIDKLSTSVFNDGSDSQQAHGLRKIIAIDRSLGGVDSTSYPWWDAVTATSVDSNFSTTNLTEANLTDPTSDYFILRVMRKVWIACQHNKEHPGMVIVSDGLWNIYEEVNEGKQSFNYSQATKFAVDAGFQVAEYRGVPLVYDEYCPGGFMFMPNDNYMKLRIRGTRNFKVGEWQKPVNQDARIAQITVALQLTCNNSRYHGSVECASAVS
jgi:hypothetical protein